MQAAGAVDPVTRVGLVLGAGGITGEAFHRGVLSALQVTAGWDARTAAIVVGTSAGSIIGASLRSPSGQPVASLPDDAPDAATSVRRIAGVGVLAAAIRRPWLARPVVLATALVPAGSRSTDLISVGVRRRFGSAWPEREMWVVAARRRDGVRVVFGREGAPPADVASAVAASCAIPGYFKPVDINGVEYVDGGIHSPTNADVLAGCGLDLVVISSPMSVLPTAARPRVDLSLRLLWHRYVVSEARRVRRSGTPVLVVEPDVATLARLSVNSMRGRHLDEIEERAAAATSRLLLHPANSEKLSLLRAGTDVTKL